MIKTLLVIDDDQALRDTLCDYFKDKPLRILAAGTLGEGVNLFSKNNVDIVLLDQKLPDGNGADICESLIKTNDHAKIIFITAYPSFSNAVQAIKAGAHDYLSKPFELEALDLTIDKALRTMALEQVEQIQSYQNRRESENTVLIGADSSLQPVKDLVDVAAASKAPVLITGETGTGKGVVAKSIHYASRNDKSAFIRINCATLPESMIESELFGHEKGAFTGADRSRSGIFEMAEGGTLFLDEIGTLPLHLQSKLLGVLDDGKIRRLGGSTFRPVNVRIIAATNIDMPGAIRNGAFREDLYYRLGVIRIHIPPLRERQEDIPALCRYFLQQIDPSQDVILDKSDMRRLLTHPWPGNVRELRNMVERAVILKRGGKLQLSDYITKPDTGGEKNVAEASGSDGVIKPLKAVERLHILRALQAFDNNRTQAARALGVSRSTLKRKIKTLKIQTVGPE